jgi:hypothetical protein
VNVTPFNSAKGSFIDWIFSSGVMVGASSVAVSSFASAWIA